jgi:hypothetical protein
MSDCGTSTDTATFTRIDCCSIRLGRHENRMRTKAGGVALCVVEDTAGHELVDNQHNL